MALTRSPDPIILLYLTCLHSYRLKVLNVNHITYDSSIYQLLEKDQLITFA